MAEDFESLFLTGIATLIATETSAVWQPDAPYAGSEAAVILGALPQSPDAALALMAYGVDDDPSLSNSVLGLQVTARAAEQDPRTVGNLAGEVYDALHGLIQTHLEGGVYLLQCLRRSHTSIGQDDNARWRTVQNFYCDVHRPSPHRQ